MLELVHVAKSFAGLQVLKATTLRFGLEPLLVPRGLTIAAAAKG
jgi:hypothetical protein